MSNFIEIADAQEQHEGRRFPLICNPFLSAPNYRYDPTTCSNQSITINDMSMVSAHNLRTKIIPSQVRKLYHFTTLWEFYVECLMSPNDAKIEHIIVTWFMKTLENMIYWLNYSGLFNQPCDHHVLDFNSIFSVQNCNSKLLSYIVKLGSTTRGYLRFLLFWINSLRDRRLWTSGFYRHWRSTSIFFRQALMLCSLPTLTQLRAL